jgi:3-deoxy-D-manno-octulosonic-acid transferase
MNRLDLAYIALATLAAPVWLRKSRRGWGERLGRVGPMLRQPVDGGSPGSPRPRVVLHAVSVGEVNALRALVPLLTPDHTVIVSTTTDTGLARARALYAETCEVVRYPLDFSSSVARFLDTVRPDAVALVELELWPNFVAACRQRGIPACVINGRLSPRSFKGYRRFRGFLGPMFRSLDFAAVQDDDYAERFAAMGVAHESLHVTGSMKWDNAVIADDVDGADDLARNLGIDRAKPLVVAGSTGPGEEALLHRSCAGLRDVQLLCAPRKPERFDEAASAMRGCVRRSRTKKVGPPVARTDRFLLDSIGELRAAYSLADAVVIGRSFADLHGSDPTEPIGLGKPTLIGPAVADFASIVRAFEDAGGIARTTRDTLGDDLRAVLADRERALELARRGRACIRANQGASARHADLIRALLGAAPSRG